MSFHDEAALRKMSGRDLLKQVADRFDSDARSYRAIAGLVPEADDAGALYDATASLLRYIATRGSIPITDRPRKDGKPTWGAELRHDIDGEYAKFAVDALRSALLARFPLSADPVPLAVDWIDPERPGDGP